MLLKKLAFVLQCGNYLKWKLIVLGYPVHDDDDEVSIYPVPYNNESQKVVSHSDAFALNKLIFEDSKQTFRYTMQPFTSIVKVT